MRRYASTLAGACLLLPLCLPLLQGQGPFRESPDRRPPTAESDDPLVILELGAATSWTTSGGAATFAPGLAAETTPIENWLELEVGVSPFYTRNATEWDTDLLFKKPWTLSPKAEFMLGVGPSWARLTQNRKTTDSLSGEIAGDFMFWPSGRHRFGWFLEPVYAYSSASGHPQALSLSAGLLLGVARRQR